MLPERNFAADRSPKNYWRRRRNFLTSWNFTLEVESRNAKNHCRPIDVRSQAKETLFRSECDRKNHYFGLLRTNLRIASEQFSNCSLAFYRKLLSSVLTPILTFGWDTTILVLFFILRNLPPILTFGWDTTFFKNLILPPQHPIKKGRLSQVVRRPFR